VCMCMCVCVCVRVCVCVCACVHMEGMGGVVAITLPMVHMFIVNCQYGKIRSSSSPKDEGACTHNVNGII